MALKDWKLKRPGNDYFWHKKGMLVTVGQSLGTKEWFVFIDGGSNVKARTEYATSKSQALSFAKSYMRRN